MEILAFQLANILKEAGIPVGKVSEPDDLGHGIIEITDKIHVQIGIYTTRIVYIIDGISHSTEPVKEAFTLIKQIRILAEFTKA